MQLYTRDLLASKIRPYQELAGFCRVTLAPGETKTVRFTVRADQFAFIGREGKWILEEGDFAFYIGRDSLSRREYKVFTQPKTIGIDPAKRGFYAEAEIL